MHIPSPTMQRSLPLRRGDVLLLHHQHQNVGTWSSLGDLTSTSFGCDESRHNTVTMSFCFTSWAWELFRSARLTDADVRYARFPGRFKFSLTCNEKKGAFVVVCKRPPSPRQIRIPFAAGPKTSNEWGPNLLSAS